MAKMKRSQPGEDDDDTSLLLLVVRNLSKVDTTNYNNQQSTKSTANNKQHKKFGNNMVNSQHEVTRSVMYVGLSVYLYICRSVSQSVNLSGVAIDTSRDFRRVRQQSGRQAKDLKSNNPKTSINEIVYCHRFMQE